LHDRIHSLFVGPDGLRVPWRLIAYLLMAFAILAVLSIFLHFWRASGVARIWLGMVSEAQLTIAVIIPAYLLSRIERRPFGDYGLPPKQAFGKLFWIGALWGLAWLTVLMLILRGTGAFYFGGIALHGVRVLKFAAFYALFFLLVGFFEEFMMRGYTQFTLTQGIGFWPAAVILSTAFGGIHLGNKGEAWIGVLAAGLIGFFFCLTLRRTGNLWFAIGFHASWDWGETYLYSVPNSGIIFARLYVAHRRIDWPGRQHLSLRGTGDYVGGFRPPVSGGKVPARAFSGCFSRAERGYTSNYTLILSTTCQIPQPAKVHRLRAYGVAATMSNARCS
jgi:membrane protease YdiL (CAAX protease family)